MRGLPRRHSRQVGDHDPSRLGLPPRIHDRATLFPDLLIIPMPGFLVDRLPDRTQDLETTQILILHKIKPESHQAADSGGGSIDGIDVELVYNVPKTPGIGPGRNALEHNRDRPGTQRTINNITMSRDPTDIRRTEINVAGLILKYIDKTVIRKNHIARAGMNNPFWLARRTGSIQDKQHIL